MSYAPQQGSVAWKVIEFLTTNPEEELNRDDIAAKFDAAPLSVHTLLRPSVEAGLLKRVELEDELVYRLGTGTPEIKPNKAAQPSLRAPGAQWLGTPPPLIPGQAPCARPGRRADRNRRGYSDRPQHHQARLDRALPAHAAGAVLHHPGRLQVRAGQGLRRLQENRQG